MEPISYSSLRPLQYSKLSCKTGLRLRSFYRYIVLKLGVSHENRFAEDIIDILYNDKVLSPTITLEDVVGAWAAGVGDTDRVVTLKFKRKEEREDIIPVINTVVEKQPKRKFSIKFKSGKDIKIKEEKEKKKDEKDHCCTM